MIHTVSHTYVNRTVRVDVTDAPDVMGVDTRARAQVVTPRRIEFFDGVPNYADPGSEPLRAALVTGPYAREAGSRSAVYRTVRIDLRNPAAVPDWLMGLAVMYLPEEPR